MGISKRVYQRLRLIGYGTVPDFSVAVQKSTTDKSPHPTLPKPHYPSKIANTLASLVKGEVLSPKKFGRLPEELPHQPSPRTNPSKNRTIPLAFRRGASLLLPLHRILPFPQQLQKDNNPSKIANTLASLVKGRWIDGKAQAFILLLSACATSAFFIHQTFLPSRRRDC